VNQTILFILHSPGLWKNNTWLTRHILPCVLPH